MDQIAFIIGETTIYWSSIVLTLAAATGICFFWAFYLGKGNDAVGAAAVVPLALVLSVVLARLIHWYCRADSYAGFTAAMTDYTSGGYALLGAFAGCLLAAVILWAMRVVDNIARMLDCMSVAGCAAIALGRLAAFFSSADRGQTLPETVGFPWAYPVTNPVSGMLENRLATFLIQAMVVGTVFLIIALLFLLEKDSTNMVDGDTTLLFLMLYGATQVILDSTRYDSLYLRSNGFVSVVQILSALALVGPIVVFSIRMVRSNGMKKWYFALWAAIAAMVGYAGYMEYYVQRHGNQAVFAYSNMGACLGGIALLGMAIWIMAARQEWITRIQAIYPLHR